MFTPVNKKISLLKATIYCFFNVPKEGVSALFIQNPTNQNRIVIPTPA